MAPRQKRKLSPASDQGEETIISGLLARASRLVVDTCKKKADRVVGTAKADADRIMTRGRHLAEVTHRAQMNKIHTDLVSALAEQDAKLVDIWQEMARLDRQNTDVLAQCLLHFEQSLADVDTVRAGCKATVEQHLQKQCHVLEAFKCTVQGEYRPVKKVKRDSDATLVNSDSERDV